MHIYPLKKIVKLYIWQKKKNSWKESHIIMHIQYFCYHLTSILFWCCSNTLKGPLKILISVLNLWHQFRDSLLIFFFINHYLELHPLMSVIYSEREREMTDIFINKKCIYYEYCGVFSLMLKLVKYSKYQIWCYWDWLSFSTIYCSWITWIFFLLF